MVDNNMINNSMIDMINYILLSIACAFIITSILTMPGISNSTKYVKKNDTETELTSKDVRTPVILLSITLLIIIIIFVLHLPSMVKRFSLKTDNALVKKITF
jgi:energy-converting hydrogenase Eha subunit A